MFCHFSRGKVIIMIENKCIGNKFIDWKISQKRSIRYTGLKKKYLKESNNLFGREEQT